MTASADHPIPVQSETDRFDLKYLSNFPRSTFRQLKIGGGKTINTDYLANHSHNPEMEKFNIPATNSIQ